VDSTHCGPSALHDSGTSNLPDILVMDCRVDYHVKPTHDVIEPSLGNVLRTHVVSHDMDQLLLDTCP
jgi:hypothetical protein